MTATIRLSVALTGVRSSRLIGNVHPMERGERYTDLLIPAGDSVTPLELHVPAGAYACDVKLPSGYLLTADVKAVDGEATEVRFDAADSPREAYAWQRLAGHVESAEQSARPVEELATSKEFFRSLADPGDAVTPTTSVPRPDVGWIGAPPASATSWQDLNELAEQAAPLMGTMLEVVAGGGWLPVLPSDEGEGTALYRFVGGGPLDGPTDPAVAGRRRFAFIFGGDNAYLVALPVPWVDVDTFEEVPAEILVEHRPSRRGSPVSVTVRDPRLGTGLAYLARGAFSSALRVFSEAEDMLFDKMTNPLAAAAGAYALVGNQPSERERWHQWVKNLRDFHEWLPDGAILAATLHLQQAASEAEAHEARDLLVQAAARGVPVYSIGLQWLVDGLAQFPEHPEAAASHAQVRRLAWRVDMAQPFVVLRLNGASR